jgi:hypothetical protein
MYAIYGNIYHQYTPNVSIYTIHGSYGICLNVFLLLNKSCLEGMSHAQSHHPTPLGRRSCLRREISTARQVGCLFLKYDKP